ncbi:hypothetical protein KY290_020361 [Solanum tuberosum]|uniref:Uncharacterized protein n=1 Tax=Solanum tuberosum TaxID=4113 RepID=A0ABQ7UZG3_SOLTU|nr:hypothetical protein KY290_020361 [Solanum tuberosum]
MSFETCIVGLGGFPKYRKKKLVMDLMFWLHLSERFDGALTDNIMKIIETSIRALAGVEYLDIARKQKNISLSYRSDVTGPQKFIQVVKSTGSGRFTGVTFPKGKLSWIRDEIEQYHQSFLWSLIFTVPVFLTSMVFMYIPRLKDGLEIKVVNMLSVGEILRCVIRCNSSLNVVSTLVRTI